jgi:hypothetical protein
MTILTCRFVGGPRDGELFAFPSEQEARMMRALGLDGDPVCGDMRVSKGQYVPMGVADELGHELYRWSGWETTGKGET